MAKTIIFIEDEFALQKTMKEFLTKKGYKVISVFDGDNGLKTAQEKAPDLILLDLILPRLDGFEVLKKLKEDEKTKDIPVIILTNLEGVEDVEKGLKLGAVTYLVKSDQNLEDVEEKINQILSIQ